MKKWWYAETMTIDQFLLHGLPNAQQQVSPPLASRGRKRPLNASQPSERPEDAPPRTPPTPTTVTVTIRELVSSALPPMQVGSNVTSSSAPCYWVVEHFNAWGQTSSRDL